MQCISHPTRSGVNTCCKCGTWLCEECTVEAGGRLFCRRCLREALDTDERAFEGSAAPARKTSGGVLFLCTLLPSGINYMYLGLIKRGFIALSGFFAACCLTSQIWGFGFVIPVLWITCAFDGFRLRRMINDGMAVGDNVDDVIGFLNQYKLLFIVLLCFILGTSISGHMLRMFTRPMGLLGIALGLYFIMKIYKKGGHKRKNKPNRSDGDGESGHKN